MSEIKEGEYARTRDGIIGKMEKYDNFEYHIRISKDDIWKTSKSFIKAHSKNIIDLIEADDYVNGHKVRRIDDKITIWIETGTNLYCGIYAKDIKNIVTKEQFNSVMYKVVE